MALPPSPRAPAALQTLAWIRRPIPMLEDCRARFGDAFTLRLAGIGDFVMFSSPEAIKTIFTTPGDVLSFADVAGDMDVILGPHSLLRLDGEAHLRERRLLMPPFHGERMQSYAAIMQKITEDAVASWPVGRPFALHEPMQAITLDVILRAVFGLEDGARMRLLAARVAAMMDRAMTPWVLLPAARVDLGPRSPYGHFLALRAQVDAILLEEIARRRAGGGLESRADILSMLLQARDEDGRPMSDLELRDELITLLLAGHETTASSLAWAFERVLAQPEVREKALAELARVVGDGGDLAPAHLPRLEYLDAVVKETLRLRPIVPLAPRRVRTPVNVGGYELPVGSVAAACIYLAHHREQNYPDPSRFDPSRFVGARPDPYAWLPFGGGIRRCIGLAFAMYEMKVVLATVLLRARLELAPGAPVRTVRRGITLVPSGGMPVVLRERLGGARERRSA